LRPFPLPYQSRDALACQPKLACWFPQGTRGAHEPGLHGGDGHTAAGKARGRGGVDSERQSEREPTSRRACSSLELKARATGSQAETGSSARRLPLALKYPSNRVLVSPATPAVGRPRLMEWLPKRSTLAPFPGRCHISPGTRWRANPNLRAGSLREPDEASQTAGRPRQVLDRSRSPVQQGKRMASRCAVATASVTGPARLSGTAGNRSVREPSPAESPGEKTRGQVEPAGA
jgi:hypothetical protein